MTSLKKPKTRLVDYQEFPFNITNCRLIFDLSPNATKVTARLRILRKDGAAFENCDLVLDGVSLNLKSIKINGNELTPSDYSIDEKQIRIKTNENSFDLETIVIINPSANAALSGLYISGGRFCTQCEAEGFRNITFWPDRPDVLSRFFVRLEAPKDEFPILLANGNPVSMGEYDDGRHFAEWDDPWPKPSYLFALVAGKLDKIEDNFTTIENRDVSLAIYVDQGNGPKALYAMDALKRSMIWDEEVFGRAYDLDVFNIVAVRDFNCGAMENKGLNIFSSALILADKDSATDVDFANIEAVVAHEYFHNWSGNRITCRDWFQLSLKEGLTVYRDQEFSADQRSRAVCRINQVSRLRQGQFIEDSGSTAHPVRPPEYAAIDNFYTATIYEKGAEVIRLTRNIVGEAAFNAAVRYYFDKYDGTAATIEDWLDAIRTNTGHSLEGIENWYSQAGTPVLTLNTSFNADEKLFTLKLSQHTPDTNGQVGIQSEKLPLPIPVHMAFYDDTGERLRLGMGPNGAADIIALNFNAKETSLEFDGLEKAPIVSIMRGFSAPVIVKSNQEIRELLVLAGHDNDAYVKWDAIQTIARAQIQKGVEAATNNVAFEPDKGFVSAIGNIINNTKDDFAFAALLLELPSINEIMSGQKNSAPELIHTIREKILGAVFEKSKDAIIAQCENYNYSTEFINDGKSAGLRAFNAECLKLLRFADQGIGANIALRAFEGATNMTDYIGGFRALSLMDKESFGKAIAQFEDKWQNNELVMDKWFAFQAGSPLGDIVETFVSLQDHKLFDIKNPSRARSVGFIFGVNNPIGFHNPNGRGYVELAALIKKLDKLNPSTAARIATAFTRIGFVSADRQILAKAAVNELLASKLSNQLSEILTSVINTK